MKSMQRKELASKEKENQEIRHNWPRKERKVNELLKLKM